MVPRKKIFFSLITTLLLTGFLSISFISYFVSKDSIVKQIKETELPLTSDNIYTEIQRDLLRPIFISSLMAQDTFVRDWVINGEKNPNEITRYLKEIQKQYGTTTSFFVSEKTRKYYHTNGILKIVKQADEQDKWYFHVKNMPQDYEINVDINTADKNSLTIFVNYRVYDYNEKYIGVIGIGLDFDLVQKLIEKYSDRYGRIVYFVNKDGIVTLHGLSYKKQKSLHENIGSSSLATKIITSPSNSVIYKKNGDKYYLNSRLIPQFNWYLIVEQKKNKNEEEIKNTLLINLGISIVISIFIILSVNMIVVSYQRKLERMATTDKLTGAYTRQVFEAIFTQIYKQHQRRKNKLSAIMLDVDHFKVPDRGSVNPTPSGGPGHGVCSGHAELQTWRSHYLGLQISFGLGCEVSISGVEWGRGVKIPRAAAIDSAE